MGQVKSVCGEDIAGRTGNIQLIKAFRKNIVTYAANTGIAKKNWEENSSYDAWLVFNIWGISNPDVGKIIPIEPELVVYRDTGVALTKHSLKDAEAKRFVEFLSSQQGNTIFKKYGWTQIKKGAWLPFLLFTSNSLKSAFLIFA